VSKYNIEPGAKVVEYISLALIERLRDITEHMAFYANQRVDSNKDNYPHVISANPTLYLSAQAKSTQLNGTVSIDQRPNTNNSLQTMPPSNLAPGTTMLPQQMYVQQSTFTQPLMQRLKQLQQLKQQAQQSGTRFDASLEAQLQQLQLQYVQYNTNQPALFRQPSIPPQRLAQPSLPTADTKMQGKKITKRDFIFLCHIDPMLKHSRFIAELVVGLKPNRKKRKLP